MGKYVTTKGTIYLFISQIIFFICGYTIHIYLGRSLGPELYGLYGITMSILIWVEMTVLTGAPQAFTKVISEDISYVATTLRFIKKWYMLYALCIMVLFFALAPLIAKKGFHDARLIGLILLAGIDIPFNGMFTSYRNVLSGAREFFKNSISRISYVVSRMVFIILFVKLGFSVQGGLIGNILGSIVALIVAYYFVKPLSTVSKVHTNRTLTPRVVSFGLPFLLYGFVDQLLVNIDFWFIKAMLNNDKYTGFYCAAQMISRLPLFFAIALNSTVFPSLSNAIAMKDVLKTKSIIRQAVRVTVILIFPLSVIIATTSKELINLLFTDEYLTSAQVLPIMICATSVYSLCGLFHAIIASENKPFLSFVFTLSIIPVAIVLNYYLIPYYGLRGAAVASLLSVVLVTIIVGIWFYNRYRTSIPIGTLVRAMVGLSVVWFLSNQFHMFGFLLVIKYIALFLIYFLVLFLLGEIKEEDKSMIRAILPVKL